LQFCLQCTFGTRFWFILNNKIKKKFFLLDDGPQKDGGERYCINSESIDFVGSDDKKEEKN